MLDMARIMPVAAPCRSSSEPRSAIVARAVTGIVGGYALAACAASLVARLLPIARVEATGWAMLASPLLFVAILLWAYTPRPLARVAAGVWGGAAACGAALALLGVRP